jgi:hypothetical protein
MSPGDTEFVDVGEPVSPFTALRLPPYTVTPKEDAVAVSVVVEVGGTVVVVDVGGTVVVVAREDGVIVNLKSPPVKGKSWE